MIKLTPTELLEYNFCPRFIYFMNVLQIPQYEERRYKVQRGREEHEKRLARNKDYLWKKLGAVARRSDVQLESERYHLRGVVDEVITLADGSMAPVDFKFTRTEHTFRSHRIQLYAYCLLIEEAFAKAVKKGYIFYIREGSRQEEIAFDEKARNLVTETINDILEIIQKEKMPKATKVRSRCADCTYKNICVR